MDSKQGFICSLVILLCDKYFNKFNSNCICLICSVLLVLLELLAALSNIIFLHINLLFILSFARYKLPCIPSPKYLTILYLFSFCIFSIFCKGCGDNKALVVMLLLPASPVPVSVPVPVLVLLVLLVLLNILFINTTSEFKNCWFCCCGL